MPQSLTREFDIKWLFRLTVQKLTSGFVLFPNHFLHFFYFHFIQFHIPARNAQYYANGWVLGSWS